MQAFPVPHPLGQLPASLPGCPVRLDLDCPPHPGLVMPVTGPPPLLRLSRQSTFHRVPVDVSQLFDELLVAGDVAIVVVCLPERPLRAADRNRKLQRLNRSRQQAALRFIHKQMYMFGHHHIPAHYEQVALAHTLEGVFEPFHGADLREIRSAAVATERQKMKSAGLLVTDAGAFHAPQAYSSLPSVRAGNHHTSPAPKCEGPGAPSVWFNNVIETGATGPIRLEATISFTIRFRTPS